MPEKAQKPTDKEKMGKTDIPLNPVILGNKFRFPVWSAWEEDEYGILWLDFLLSDISFASDLLGEK